MTDEEKRAIKDCDSIFICLDDAMSEDSANDYRKSYKILKNLIEKQSKEIEHQIEKRANQKKELSILNEKQIEFNKLVNTVNSYKGQFKKQQKEIEELKREKAIYYYEWNHLEANVINKIQEYDDKGMTVNLVNRSAGKTFQQAVHYEVKKVLQSLLDKE